MKNILPLLIVLIGISHVQAQVNVISTNPLAEQIMLGNYKPADYNPSSLPDKSTIVQSIQDQLSADSLKSYLERLGSFKNRNTGADTVSQTEGIGATRRWIHQWFEQLSDQRNQRLITSYLQFDRAICGMTLHRNIFTVLPGTDVSDKSIVLIEAHVDSRCESGCDPDCLAEGIDDNASGTALVMELARVMSLQAYKRTIVFLVTIGEEQGLVGAEAFAEYCKDKGITIRAVQNNDVVGGIVCGETSSPPSCPGANDVDSTSVRIFSFGANNSPHKGYARFVKLEYQEELLPKVEVPMNIRIMNAEDRTGRGGDHIPFRREGYTAIRFNAANEHGDGGGGNPNYVDRQHSIRDILGIDTNNDGEIDSFFVDFNYIRRNAAINGVSAAMAAQGPLTPEFDAFDDGNGLSVEINTQQQYRHYRIGIRTQTNDFDTVYTIFDRFNFKTYDVKVDSSYFISVASVDNQGIESIFSEEKLVQITSLPATGLKPNPQKTSLELLPTRPNPFDETTTISVVMRDRQSYQQAYIRIADLQGREIDTLPLDLSKEVNEVIYNHGFGAVGIFTYSLVVDGQVLQTRKMVFNH